jgi:dihydroorotate dehydrogenase (NAD+) catalytic subunit
MVSIRAGPVTVGGVAMANHLILAAGILGTTGASLARMLAAGAGAVVTKSIGPEPKDGHAGPCLVVLDDGILNAMGLPNPSMDFVDELTVLKGKPVIASIYGGSPEEFAMVGEWFSDKAAFPVLMPRDTARFWVAIRRLSRHVRVR